MEITQLQAPQLEGIEASKAAQIQATFEPMASMLKELELRYNNVIQNSLAEITPGVEADARALRLQLVKLKTATEKIRHDTKEEHLRAGKAVDGVSNILKWAILDKITKLKDIENHSEILKAAHIEALQASRALELSKYEDTAESRDLGNMEDDVWDLFIKAKETNFLLIQEAKKKAKEESDRLLKEAKALEEETRRLELEEQARVNKENEILKLEAIKRDNLLRIEKAKADEALRIINENKAKAQAKADIALRAQEAETQRQQFIANEAVRKKQEEVWALEQSLLKIKEEEALKLQQEKEEAEALLTCGDLKIKEAFAKDIKTIGLKYTFESLVNKAKLKEIQSLFTTCLKILKEN